MKIKIIHVYVLLTLYQKATNIRMFTGHQVFNIEKKHSLCINIVLQVLITF